MILADAHCDTITYAMDKRESLFNCSGHLNLKKLESAFDGCMQFMAVWIQKSEGAPMKKLAIDALNYFYEQKNLYASAMRLILNKKDAEVGLTKQVGILLSLEGGELLEGELENISMYYEMGVRSICLTWNGHNELGDGVMVNNACGLTEFGKEAIREMNSLGMIVDVSHASKHTFWDAVEFSTFPVIASHSNAFAVCPHIRNLDDAQLRAIGEKRGFAGINMYSDFIAEDGASEYWILKHIEHMLRVAGEDCVGLGCDFDGIERTPEGYNSVSNLPKLYNRLENTYGVKLADKIFYKNLIRVVRTCLK